MVTQISNGMYLLNEGGRNSSLLQLTGSSRDVSFGGGPLYDSLGHIRWGAGDNQPNIMRALIEKNTIVQSLLDSLRDMIYGSGVGFFQRTLVDGKSSLLPYTDKRLEDWAWATDLQDYAVSAISQRVDNANIFTKWKYSPMDDWFTLSVLDSFKTRIAQNEKEYLINPYFGSKTYWKSTDSDRLRAFDRNDREYNVKQTVTCSHSRNKIAGQPHYAFPSWWCAEEAIELANLITAFHKSGILNRYNIKYLIKMPSDHFDKEGGRNVDSKEVKKRWSKFSDNLSGWLAGQKNVNKTMLVKYMRGSDGKAMDNVDVVPLKNEMSDEAYDKVFKNANQSIANSVGLLPTLAGVNPGSGNDSGSQIRVMADYQQHFRTSVHRLYVLKDINVALRMMGYTDVQAGFKEVQITTLDVNPTGSQAVVNQQS